MQIRVWGNRIRQYLICAFQGKFLTVFHDRHKILFILVIRRLSGCADSTLIFYFAIICLTVLDGEVAAPCNPQSAAAGWNSCMRALPVEQSRVGDDEILVLCNRTLRTVSDPDGSSTKEFVLCAAGLPESSCWL